MKKRFFRAVAWCVVFAACLAPQVSAFVPYDNYIYNSDGDLKNEPQAYVVSTVLDGAAMAADTLSGPSDVCQGPDGRIYVADTGNNRVVILDKDFQLVDQIRTFGTGDGFSNPQGIFVSEENVLYVADTDNERILSFSQTGELLKIYPKPEIPIEDDNFNYKPIRVCVDSAGRLFVVSRNMNKGMIQMDKEGNFISFFGAVEVEKNVFDLVWKKILTQEQLDNSTASVPTEYAACDIDAKGFVFGTVSATGTQTGGEIFIRRLNPSGTDVLKRNGAHPPMGDIVISLNSKGVSMTSRLADISTGENGMYSVLDTLRGRVFVYDQEGYLLYVFGSLGKNMGAMMAPKALEWLSDGRFVVADANLGALLVYEPTHYADLIHTATVAQYNRNYELAQQTWQEVLDYSAYSELAYIGMGKALYRQGEYKKAMEYFHHGNDRTLYSKAFGKYSAEVMEQLFLPAVYVAAGAAVVYGLWRLWKRRRDED